MQLNGLVASLQQSVGVLGKRDIQTAAAALDLPYIQGQTVQLGDDCAAIADGDGYLLLAAEGMLPEFVAQEPWFAGWCSVMVNVSDVCAMGGRPLALVNALWSGSEAASQPIWRGMTAAAQAYGVAIVGGHTNCHSTQAGLAAAILGRAQRLITSFAAQPGDCLVLLMETQAEFFGDYPFWNGATRAEPTYLRRCMDLLPAIAEAGLCKAGKDISMGGIAGTLLMLMETSGCGAVLNLDQIPCPAGVPLDRWLTCFPSFGFLLSVDPDRVKTIQRLVQQTSASLACAVIGQVISGSEVWLEGRSDRQLFWDLAQAPLTGFGQR